MHDLCKLCLAIYIDSRFKTIYLPCAIYHCNIQHDFVINHARQTIKPSENKFQISNSSYCGTVFQAIINKGNIYGVQFHPEKSGKSGLKLINNFIHL